MPWLWMAWLWSWCFVALSLPLTDLLRSVRYQDAAGGDERCHTARAHSVPRGCARISAGHLPGGADAIVVVCNDRDVQGAAALRCCAQLGQDQGLELRFCLRQLLEFCPRRLVGHGSLLKRDAATFERGRILLRLPRTSAAHSTRDSTSAERAA